MFMSSLTGWDWFGVVFVLLVIASPLLLLVLSIFPSNTPLWPKVPGDRVSGNTRGDSKKQLAEIQAVVSRAGHGVHKRIDENREMLELLQTSAPDVLEKFPWVEGWLRAHDEFFTGLAELVEVENRAGRKSSLPYPRPWPGGETAGRVLGIRSGQGEPAKPTEKIAPRFLRQRLFGLGVLIVITIGMFSLNEVLEAYVKNIFHSEMRNSHIKSTENKP